MRIEIDEFRVRERDHVDLEKRATCVRAVYRSEDHLRDLLQRHVSKLSDVQQILYAANLLIATEN